MPELNRPKHVYEIYIRTTPEDLWRAITDPLFIKQYFFGQTVGSDWRVGSPYTHRAPDGTATIDGTILEIDPPRRLVHSFTCPGKEETKGDRATRVTWLIEKLGETCRLTLIHGDFEGETATFKNVGKGWSEVLSGLKTLLETGVPLVIGAA